MRFVRTGAIVVTASLVGTLLVGCTSNDEASTTSSAPSLAGTWFVTDPKYSPIRVLRLTDEKPSLTQNAHSWSVSSLLYADYEEERSGTYGVAGDTITFESYCEPDDEDQYPAPGVYTYTLEGDILALSLTADSCWLRRAFFDGQTFTRLAEPPGPSVADPTSLEGVEQAVELSPRGDASDRP